MVKYPGKLYDRTAILVQKKGGCEGERIIFAVKGGMRTGMDYSAHALSADSGVGGDGFVRKKLVGLVDDADVAMIAGVCESISPPRRQYRSDGTKVYPDALTRRSEEWVEEVVLQLEALGILEMPYDMVSDYMPERYVGRQKDTITDLI